MRHDFNEVNALSTNSLSTDLDETEKLIKYLIRSKNQKANRQWATKITKLRGTYNVLCSSQDLENQIPIDSITVTKLENIS